VEFEWLPSDLTIKSNALVMAHRKAFGGSLPKLLWQRDTMVFVGMHPDLLTLLGSATAAWKMSLVLGVVATLALVFAAIVTWWVALALIPACLAMAYFKRRETEFYTLIAAIILALEMLADDFAGWGTRFPVAMQQASQILGDNLRNHRTRLLDVCLPQRANIESTLLEQFGPTG
jgi:hypothetical protein